MLREFSLIFIQFTYWSTGDEWVASEPIGASTNSLMIVNIAGGLRGATANARINATFIYTCQITRTFGIGNTLRPAIWSASNIIW